MTTTSESSQLERLLGREGIAVVFDSGTANSGQPFLTLVRKNLEGDLFQYSMLYSPDGQEYREISFNPKDIESVDWHTGEMILNLCGSADPRTVIQEDLPPAVTCFENQNPELLSQNWTDGIKFLISRYIESRHHSSRIDNYHHFASQHSGDSDEYVLTKKKAFDYLIDVFEDDPFLIILDERAKSPFKYSIIEKRQGVSNYSLLFFDEHGHIKEKPFSFEEDEENLVFKLVNGEIHANIRFSSKRGDQRSTGIPRLIDWSATLQFLMKLYAEQKYTPH